MNTTIILTSTVNVNYKKNCLFQINTNERINTYLKSILQWLEQTNFNIILVENSGYDFTELNIEKEKYKNRFEIISFNELTLDDAVYLNNNDSKGASEMFAINYAFNNSKIIHTTDFIIKITCRFFIPELENYLMKFDLNNYDSLTQNDRDRCEMVGCHYSYFYTIFNKHLLNKNNQYDGHVENIWKFRTYNCNNLTCKIFEIEKTQRGGIQMTFDNI